MHAVPDTTNHEYLAIVKAVLDEIEAGVRKRKWIAPSSLVELDAILSAICDELIYVQRKGPAHGQKLHATWAHVYLPDPWTSIQQGSIFLPDTKVGREAYVPILDAGFIAFLRHIKQHLNPRPTPRIFNFSYN